VDAAERYLSVRWIKTPTRVGEVDAPIGAADYIVRPVQALALPPLGDGFNLAIFFPASDLAVVSFTHNEPALEVEGQPIGTTTVLADDLCPAAGDQPEDEAATYIHEEQVALGVPERTFSKLKASSQTLWLC
jgi:hypothetical protein